MGAILTKMAIVTVGNQSCMVTKICIGAILTKMIENGNSKERKLVMHGYTILHRNGALLTKMNILNEGDCLLYLRNRRINVITVRAQLSIPDVLWLRY